MSNIRSFHIWDLHFILIIKILGPICLKFGKKNFIFKIYISAYHFLEHYFCPMIRIWNPLSLNFKKFGCKRHGLSKLLPSRIGWNPLWAFFEPVVWIWEGAIYTPATIRSTSFLRSSNFEGPKIGEGLPLALREPPATRWCLIRLFLIFHFLFSKFQKVGFKLWRWKT